MRYGFLATSFRALVPVALLLASLTASADGPAGGGTPSASQLQRAHDLGQNMANSHFDAEVFPEGGPPPKDLLHSRLDKFLKEQGSQLSDAEKEVFTEAYWNKFDKRTKSFVPMGMAGMPQIDPPNLTGASPTTVVSGKTATPGPGTLQLTDAGGNSHFVDVDANGNYSTTVPQGNFQPVKMTFRTGTLKAAWELKDGKWTQIASAAGAPGTQGAMAPSRGTAQATGQQFALLDDECKQYALVGSLDSDAEVGVADSGRSTLSPLLLPVRFSGEIGSFSVRRDRSFARLVGEGPPPTPTESGHRLADLERYKQQGKDSYGNDLPQDPAQREQKVNEREAKIQTEKGKLSTPDPTWPPGGEEQMRKAYLERQRYYLEQDFTAVENKAKAAGKTGKDLRQDPDVKKARQALLENENDFLRNKLPVGTNAPATMTTPSGTTGAMVPTTPGGATSAVAIGQQTTYVIKGTARMGSGVAIPKGTFATGAMLALHETPEEFVKPQTGDDVRLSATLGGPIVKDRFWLWGAYTANEKSSPLAEVDASGNYEFKYTFGLDYGSTKDFKVGLDYQYKTAFSVGYNYGCAKQSFADLAAGKEIPTTAIEDRTQLIKGMKPGANLWQVDEEFVNHGLGHVQGWDPWESPNSTFTPRTWFAYKIAETDIPKFNQFGSWFFNTVGPNYGINTAPAPAWKPENWPHDHPKGIPTARVSRKGGRP